MDVDVGRVIIILLKFFRQRQPRIHPEIKQTQLAFALHQYHNVPVVLVLGAKVALLSMSVMLHKGNKLPLTKVYLLLNLIESHIEDGDFLILWLPGIVGT